MADLDELYRRVEICERLLHSLCARSVTANPDIGPQGGGTTLDANGPQGGGKLNYEIFMFPFNDEAHIIHNDKSYNLNFAVGAFIENRPYGNYILFRQNGTMQPWFNISKSELFFLDKTIYNVVNNYDLLSYPIGNASQTDDIVNDMFVDITNPIEKEQLWNKIKKQLIITDTVVTITRETIREALFESRLKIHEIKNAPPRMNQLMHTVTPPVTPRPDNLVSRESREIRPPYVIGTGNPLLTPRMNQLTHTVTPPITPRPITPRQVTSKKLKLVPRERQFVPNQLRLSLNRAPRKSRRNKNRQYPIVDL